MNKKSLFFWFVAFVCAALIFTGCPQEPDDDDTVTPVTASFTDVTVSGEKGVELTGVDVTLTITGDKIGEAITANDDLLAWITGTIPAWLTATAKADVAAGAASVVITIGGTPAAASSEVLGLKIPAAALAGGADITATGKITLAVTYPAAEAAGDLASTLGVGAEVDSSDPTKVTLTAGTVTIEEGDEVTVPAGVTLAVPGDKTLAVEGTLEVAGTVSVASGGILKGPVLGEYGAPSESNTISYTGSGKVELEQGAEGYYGESLFISAGETGLYKWDGSGGKITLKGSNTTELTAGKVIVRADTGVAPGTTTKVANGATLTVSDGVTYTVYAAVDQGTAGTLTVDGALIVAGTVTSAETINGTGSVTVTATGTVPGIAYSLSTSENANPTDLTYESATKNLATGLTTVRLGGTVEGGITEWAKTNIWGADPGEDAPDGNWSWAVITGILPADLEANSGIEIKQTNASLLYYRGIELGDVSSESSLPNEAPTITDGDGSTGCIFFVGDTAYKWAKYGAGRNPTDTDDDGFGVLLWSGADPKTAQLEITPKNGTPYTVIVDWSGVTINAPAEE